MKTKIFYDHIGKKVNARIFSRNLILAFSSHIFYCLRIDFSYRYYFYIILLVSL